MQRPHGNCTTRTTEPPVRSLSGRFLAAAFLALFVAACGRDTPTEYRGDGTMAPGPQFALDDPANGSGICLGDDAVFWPGPDGKGYVKGIDPDKDYGEGGNTLNCTANDIYIANAVVSEVFDEDAFGGQGGFVPFDPQNPPQCTPGEDVTFKMTANLAENANSARADIGVWIATDGGNAETGTCNHYNLVPGAAPDPGNPDEDQCGGMADGSQIALDLGELTVPCNSDEEVDPDLDEDTIDELIIGACLTWKVPSDEGDDLECPNNADGTAPDNQATDFRAGTLPTNKSKCNCEPFTVPILVLKKATIEVVKECDPTGDDGTFDLEIDDSGDPDYFLKNDAACGESTGPQEVGAGDSQNPGADHTVAESDYTAANYTSTLECTVNGEPFDPPISGAYNTPGTDVTVHVEPDDVVVCTFTNERKGNVVIKKETDPDGATGSFTFPQPFDGSGDCVISDGGSCTYNNVVPGQYTVTENDPTPAFDLTDITCDDANSTGDKDTRTATYNVEPGETVTCTFTNTQRGTVILAKETDPDATTDDFTIVQNIDGSGDCVIADGESCTYNNVVPGNYTATENDPKPFYDLYDLVCDDDASDTPSVETVSTRQAAIKVDPGETVTCTFYNRQRAKVTVNKTESGTLPLTRAHEFEIRVGASPTEEGTTVAAGSAVLATGVVNFLCSSGSSAYCAQDNSTTPPTAYFVPGDYQLCEVNMLAGWLTSLNGGSFVPNSDDPLVDNGVLCINITLSAGEEETHNIDNTPPPGGDARTIGFWKNHSCQAPGNQEDVLTPLLPITLATGDANTGDDFVISSCETAVFLLDKRDLTNKHTKQASDAAYGLAAQLIAALLNVASNAATCPVPTSTIQNAQLLLDQINFDGTGSFLGPKVKGATLTLRNTALSYEAILDAWNNNDCP